MYPFATFSVEKHSKRPSGLLLLNDDDEPSHDLPSPGEFKNTGRRLNLPAYFSTKSRRTLRPGALSFLKDFPVDILCEIFSHLHPIDLLTLSRTSKCLRSLLLSKNATSVWRQALMLVEGFPECPPDMSEPEYSSLAFDNICHFCSGPAPNLRDIFWNCRSRCCQSCLNSQFVTEYELEQEIPQLSSLRQKEAIIPYVVYPKPSRRRPGRILYSLVAAKQIAQELDSDALESDSQLLQWQREKLLKQMERLQHARLCESWCARWSYRRPEDFTHVLIPALLVFLAYLWREQIPKHVLG